MDRQVQGPVRRWLRGHPGADPGPPERDGPIPAGTELPPVNPIGTPQTRTGPDGLPFPALDYTRPWDSLNEEERRLFARMAEVYAGFLAHADHHIGRLLDYLEQNDELDNTMIVVVSDNGASAARAAPTARSTR